MRELEMALKAVAAEVDNTVDELVKTAKKSTEYNQLIGKLEAYTDIQNLLIWRINEIQKGSGK